MTNKAEFIGRPTVLRCFLLVLEYLHANFTIVLEMTELDVDIQSASKRGAEESSSSAFRQLDKKKVIIISS